MKKAIFAGTFDPVHFGHIDIVEVASLLFDEVLWVNATNSAKKPMFSPETRHLMMENVVDRLDRENVKVETLLADIALVDLATMRGAQYLVRSFRLTADFEYELQLALINRKLDSGIQTVYLPPKQEHLHISSTAVRELIRLRKPLDDYMPDYLRSLF